MNKKELEYMCRRMKRVQIVRIKRSKYKALAVIQVEKTDEEDVPWAIPVDNNKLVRVTKGIEDYETREKQRRYIVKLTELLRNASEVLLLRCLRSKKVKSVHIPPNRNENQKRTVTIMFASEEDMKAAQSKPIMYNNFRVYWINGEGKKAKRRGSFAERRERSWDRFSETSDTGNKDKRERQRNQTYTNKERNEEFSERRDSSKSRKSKTQNQSTERQRKYMDTTKKGKKDFEERLSEMKTQTQDKGTYVEDILDRILERLGRLEEARERTLESLANRS